jgi:ATP-dependent DNA helicase RecG
LIPKVLHASIVLQIEESSVKPVPVYGRPFKRVGRSNHRLSSSEISKLVLESTSASWDAGIMGEANLSFIDDQAIRRFLETAVQERNLDIEPRTPIPEALEKLNLLRGGKLTRAAILLLGKRPQREFLQAQVRCARFKGTKSLDFLDMQVIEGNLVDQVTETMRFIQKNISLSAEIKELQREERWEYPLPAVREAIVNAICHRDYRDPGNVQVRIFDDRLEVWNPGLLPEGLSIEDLKRSHASRPRNKLIAHAFFLIKYIEQWGTGTLRMMEVCRTAGFPEPEFVEMSGDFMVTFHKSRFTEEYLERLGLTERQRHAVEYVRAKGRITNREYVDLTGVSRPTATRDLTELVRKGILRQHGHGKGSYFELAPEK